MKTRKTTWRSSCTGLALLAGLGLGMTANQCQAQLIGADLGSPGIAGEMTTSGITNIITVGGSDIWNTSDNGYFAYTNITSPVWDAVVRVHDLVSPSSSWGKVELMVRADQGNGAPEGNDMFIAEMTTQPSSYTATDGAGVNWVVDQFRSAVGGNADWIHDNTTYHPDIGVNGPAGNPAPSYPNRWMRLTRQGSVFKTMDSTDGVTWNTSAVIDTADPNAQPAGNDSTTRFNTPFTNSVWVGVAVTAHTDAEAATARFSDFKITVVSDLLFINDPASLPIGFSISVNNIGAAIADPSTATLTFDGQTVPVTKFIEAADKTSTTFYYYDVTKPLTIGSEHTVVLNLKDTRGIDASATKKFTVASYATLTANEAVTGVDTSKPGFNVRMHYRPNTDLVTQEPLVGYEMENTIARAEQQLYGTRGASILTAANGNFTAATINYSFDVDTAGDVAQVGAFVGPDTPDTTPAGIDPNLDTSNIAAELTTYIDFPDAGVYNLIFNSDDGFRTTSGANVGELLNSVVVGQADVGRGAADTIMQVYVPAAGFYPLRTVWFQGGGGANLEFSGNEVVPATNPRRLLGASAADALKVYQVKSSASPAAVTFINPARNSGNPYIGNVNIDAELQDPTGGTVDQGSIKLSFNGADVTVTPTKSGDRTKISYDPPGNLPPNTTNTVVLSFTAGTQQYSATNTFTTANSTILQPNLALPAASVDKTKPGFLVKTVQHAIRNYNAAATDAGADHNLANSIYRAQTQLAGYWGWPNTADLSMFTGPGGYYQETATINYNGLGGSSGYFPDDPAVPGMPGTGNEENGIDWYSQEVLTVLDLKPGYYVMNVNSDDNFALYAGNPNEWKTLPILLGMYGASYSADAGRGNGGGVNDGTSFTFEVKEAGLYPFRLVWEQGGGGHNVEWSTRQTSNGTIIPIAKLVNDTSTADGVAAYQYPLNSVGAPYLKSFAPGRSSWDTSNSTGRAGQDATVKAVIDQGVANIDTASVTMAINGAPVTADVTKSGSEITASYKPAAGFAMGSTNAVSLTFAGRTVGWTFIVGLPATPTFWIEAADFDYESGKTKPEASVMPYFGGAYAGLSAVEGTDYDGNGTEPSNPYYRQPANLGVPVSVATDFDRGGGEVVVNYRLGWMGGAHWFNYTRTFPAGKYNVYAALSHGDATSSGTRMRGNLQDVTGGASTTLGVFDALTSGGWGNNVLVPLKDAAATNSIVALDLSGTKTLRYNDGNGDIDYFLFAPAAEQGGEVKITKVSITGGSITVTWDGGGALWTSTDLKAWEAVAGATTGTYTGPATADKYRFYRAQK